MLDLCAGVGALGPALSRLRPDAAVICVECDGTALQCPPCILLLDSPAYDEELRALIEWVEGVLVPGYLAWWRRV